MKSTHLELEIQRYREQMLRCVSDLALTHIEAVNPRADNISVLFGGLGGLPGARPTDGGFHADLARLTVMAPECLAQVVALLARAAKSLGAVEKGSSSSAQTAAAELYRSGSRALAKASEAKSADRSVRWYELAHADLLRAVETYGYHAKAWYNLAVALACLGEAEKAAETFSQCAFFSVSESPELAAAAVLLSAALFRKVNRGDRSQEVLNDYSGDLEDCAEIHLALAVHHAEHDGLRAALNLWPFLAADARGAGVPGVEDVADDLCQGPDGWLVRLQRLHDGMRSVADSAMAAGVPGVEALIMSADAPVRGVDSLLICAAVWLASVERADRLTTCVCTGLRQLDYTAQAIARKGDLRVREIEKSSVDRSAYASKRIARMLQDGKSRAAQAYTARLKKHDAYATDAEKRAARAAADAVMREVQAECGAAEKASVQSSINDKREAESVAAAAKAESVAAAAKYWHASEAVAEPLATLAEQVRDGVDFTRRVIPFNISGYLTFDG